jgi:putative NADPH-quinone reductase
MNVLQIIAHPDPEESSFTHALAKSFRNGAAKADHNVSYFKIFDLVNADRICFAWPCWWEMPPAKLVDLLQTVFVRGFAFDLAGDRMVPKLNIPTTCLISMGQNKQLNTTNLLEAMTYCGLHPQFAVFQNVGPRLQPELAEAYLDTAFRLGQQL